MGESGTTSCFLGCVNNRRRAYFELAHEINKKNNVNHLQSNNNNNGHNVITNLTMKNPQSNIESSKKKAFSVRKQQAPNNHLGLIKDKR